MREERHHVIENLKTRLDMLENRVTTSNTNRTKEKPLQNKQRFQTTFRPSLVMSSSNRAEDEENQTIRGLLKRLQEEKSQRTTERGSLQLALTKEKQKAQKAEMIAHRAEEQLDFRMKELKHLKDALKNRNEELQEALQEKEQVIEKSKEMMENIRGTSVCRIKEYTAGIQRMILLAEDLD